MCHYSYRAVFSEVLHNVKSNHQDWCCFPKVHETDADGVFHNMSCSVLLTAGAKMVQDAPCYNKNVEEMLKQRLMSSHFSIH